MKLESAFVKSIICKSVLVDSSTQIHRSGCLLNTHQLWRKHLGYFRLKHDVQAIEAHGKDAGNNTRREYMTPKLSGKRPSGRLSSERDDGDDDGLRA